LANEAYDQYDKRDDDLRCFNTQCKFCQRQQLVRRMRGQLLKKAGKA
jgi:hypothetical protein